MAHLAVTGFDPVDPALGRYWFDLAAGHGSHEAVYQLSLQQVDQEQQLHWLTLAADGGVTKAWFELAQLQQEQGVLDQAEPAMQRPRNKVTAWQNLGWGH